MELKNLDTFIQVAELCSFTKAAEKLGYSQSTVSFQIKQLETSLNTQLFERINHTVHLTEKGREVLQYAHQISILAQKMQHQIQTGEELQGHIRIATADSLCTWLVKNGFEQFHQNFPHITIKITPASTEDMFRMLNQNETDLMFTLDSHIYDRDYIIASEKKMDVHFVQGTGHFFQDKDPVSIQELVNCPFILTEKGMSYRRLLDEKLSSMSLEIHPILEIGNGDLICHLLEQGIGISLLPDFVTQKYIEKGTLRYVPLEGFDLVVWKQLLYHRSKWVSPQLQAVIDYLSLHA